VVGVTAEDRAHLIYFRFNDVESIEEAAKAAGDDLAAIVVSGHRHDLGVDQEMPTSEFARAARRLCDAKGAALILDEVRTGMRIHAAGSWEPLQVRPDLAAWSKAIANGHAIAAVTGSEHLRRAASEIFVTGSFWAAAVPMAAALATLKVVRRDDVPGRLLRIGTMLREGLDTRALQYGVKIRQSGPVSMPLILFDDDADFRKGTVFCNAAIEKGVYFHPKHNMFLCAAHGEADVATALAAAEHGFAAVKALT
jgi:glutamate-1-semialdehyde 2,1-aminomutase